VTIVALAAAFVVLRRFMPARRRPAAGSRGPAAPVACDHCATGAKATAAPNGSTARTHTTPVVSVDDLRASSRGRRR
ncbi:MAG: hypothetical protein ABIT71_04375, partial [Vicinamibacteraceae bacterium]